jgi:hypothetical protein
MVLETVVGALGSWGSGIFSWGLDKLADLTIALATQDKPKSKVPSDASGLQGSWNSIPGDEFEDYINRAIDSRIESIRNCNNDRDIVSASRIILPNQPYFANFIDVNSKTVQDISRNPTNYGIIHGDRLKEVKNLDFYRSNSVFTPYVFADSNRDLIIAELPISVLRHAFLNHWDTPATLGRFTQFGLTGHEIMPEISPWFSRLPREDQIYFSQLYKEFCDLAKFTNQQIPSLTEFCQDIYIKRDRILRLHGASSVHFRLDVKSNGSRLTYVSTEAYIFPS